MKLPPLLFVSVLLSNIEFSSSKICEIPIPEQLRKCYSKVKDTPVDTFVGSVYTWLCEHSSMNYTNPNELTKENSNTIKYINQFYNKVITNTLTDNKVPNRGKRQALSPCVRKEYRMLTLDERRRYHNAVNALKRDTSTFPNLYDSIANIHTGRTNRIAHGGPGFLGWHRIYLLGYENALRQKDPSVCLPYWDSTLDRQLSNPLLSSFWSPDFLGTSQGVVLDGPFANWRLPNGGQLIRNVGSNGDLLNSDYVRDVLSRNSYNDIVTSQGQNPMYLIENHHGSVHLFVGGAMQLTNTAAFDPVFFMHHAFVDYIFEQFRQRLRSRGVNPNTYPTAIDDLNLHGPNAPTLLGESTQAVGYSDSIARRVTYEPVPTCNSTSTSCGGRFLVCQLSSRKCIPTTRSSPPRPPTRTRRSVPNTYTTATCENQAPPTFDLPYQNNFCSRDFCDTSQWVILPVKIVSVRPPKYSQYSSFPVTNGDVNYKEDLYSPNAYEDTSKYISKCYGNLKTYPRCEKDFSTGQIFIYSHGINYSGYYVESTIVDQKLTVSLSLGFVAVRKPSTVEDGVSQVLIRAHDSCGRVCQVACRNPVTNEYQICSGAIAVTDEVPLMFGHSFDEAVLDVIDYKTNIFSPKIRLENIYLTFYCDYRDGYPLAELPDTVVPSI